MWLPQTVYQRFHLRSSWCPAKNFTADAHPVDSVSEKRDRVFLKYFILFMISLSTTCSYTLMFSLTCHCHSLSITFTFPQSSLLVRNHAFNLTISLWSLFGISVCVVLDGASTILLAVYFWQCYSQPAVCPRNIMHSVAHWTCCLQHAAAHQAWACCSPELLPTPCSLCRQDECLWLTSPHSGNEFFWACWRPFRGGLALFFLQLTGVKRGGHQTLWSVLTVQILVRQTQTTHPGSHLSQPKGGLSTSLKARK